MAKKKKARRKSNFSYSRPAGQQSARPQPRQPVSRSETDRSSLDQPATVAPKPSSDEVIDVAVITTDLKQILKLVLGFVLLELVLWYVLQHTSLGTHFYNLF